MIISHESQKTFSQSVLRYGSNVNLKQPRNNQNAPASRSPRNKASIRVGLLAENGQLCRDRDLVPSPRQFDHQHAPVRAKRVAGSGTKLVFLEHISHSETLSGAVSSIMHCVKVVFVYRCVFIGGSVPHISL